MPACPNPANGKDNEPIRQVALEEASHMSENDSMEESDGLFGTLRHFTAKSCRPHINSSCSPSVIKASSQLRLYQLRIMDTYSSYHYSTALVGFKQCSSGFRLIVRINRISHAFTSLILRIMKARTVAKAKGSTQEVWKFACVWISHHRHLNQSSSSTRCCRCSQVFQYGPRM